MARNSETATIIIRARDLATKTMDKVGMRVKSLAKATAANLPAGLAASAAAFTAATKAAVSYGDSIAKASARAGVATDEFQAWALGIREAGGRTQDLEKGLVKLNRTIGDAQAGSTGAIDVFNGLGVSFEDAEGNARDTNEVFRDAVDRLSRLDNQAQKAAFANQLFGRSWTTLTRATRDGAAGLLELEARAGATGQIIGADLLRQAEEAQDQFERFGTATKALSTSFLLQFAPALGAVTEKLHGYATAQSLAIAAENRQGGAAELAGQYQRIAEKVELLREAQERLANNRGLAGDEEAVTRLTREIGQAEQAIVHIGNTTLVSAEQMEAGLRAAQRHLSNLKKDASGFELEGITAALVANQEALAKVQKRAAAEREAREEAASEAELKRTSQSLESWKASNQAKLDSLRLRLAKATQSEEDALALQEENEIKAFESSLERGSLYGLREDEALRLREQGKQDIRAFYAQKRLELQGQTEESEFLSAREHTDRLVALLHEMGAQTAMTAEQRDAAELKTASVKAQTASNIASSARNLTSILGAENKKEFERNKKLRIGAAVADTYAAGVRTMAEMAAAEPFTRIAAMTAVITAGLASVASIRKSRFGGGGGGTGGGGGGAGGGAAPRLPGAPGFAQDSGVQDNRPGTMVSVSFSGRTRFSAEEVTDFLRTASDVIRRNGGRLDGFQFSD